MKVKTAELIGPALDWAVAKCESDYGVWLDRQHCDYKCPHYQDGGPASICTKHLEHLAYSSKGRPMILPQCKDQRTNKLLFTVLKQWAYDRDTADEWKNQQRCQAFREVMHHAVRIGVVSEFNVEELSLK